MTILAEGPWGGRLAEERRLQGMKLVQGGKGGHLEILIASVGMRTPTESADSVQ